jgi:hypothetical protein
MITFDSQKMRRRAVVVPVWSVPPPSSRPPSWSASRFCCVMIWMASTSRLAVVTIAPKMPVTCAVVSMWTFERASVSPPPQSQSARDLAWKSIFVYWARKIASSWPVMRAPFAM